MRVVELGMDGGIAMQANMCISLLVRWGFLVVFNLIRGFLMG